MEFASKERYSDTRRDTKDPTENLLRIILLSVTEWTLTMINTEFKALGYDGFDGFLQKVFLKREIDVGEFGVNIFQDGLHRDRLQVGVRQQGFDRRFDF